MMDNGIRSEINHFLTLEYMINEDENKYFDRKSAAIKPSDLAQHISAFANAEGGTLVIGISDKARKIEGINSYGAEKINAFIAAPKTCCKPMPHFKEEFLDVINSKGENDRILLLHIFASVDRIIRTTNDSTYLRIGDKSKELKGEDLRNLEYAKSTSHFEDEICEDVEIDDLDADLIKNYKSKIGAPDIETSHMLRARGFLKRHNKEMKLTYAAVLLFAENPLQFYPNCRIRFIRYDGTAEQVGTNINIIKDVNIEAPILKIIEQAKSFISSQLREFTALNPETGMFQIVPEYPEFAWLEGIVNAVTHREYGISGRYIKVSMFDDRLEIESPGKLPNIVNVDNIQSTRYSRNPRIARVLTEFGWVRELNEGVRRIYTDMQSFYLDPPIYTEPDQSVKLTLKNNIAMRTMRQENRIATRLGDELWNELDELEKSILSYMAGKNSVTTIELAQITHVSTKTINVRINDLISKNIVKANGKKRSPKITYSLIGE